MAAANLSYKLHPKLRTIARNLPRVARELGFEARVTSGYRSRASQARLYQNYIQGLSHYPAAPPGYSDHERGVAIDVVSTDTPKLVDILTSVGLSWAGPSDAVHFSMSGLKSKPTAKSSYYESVGSRIPSFLTQVPIIGKGLSVVRDPSGSSKFELKKLITAITGGWL